MLKIRNISKTYKKSCKKSIENINFEIYEGDLLG